MLALSAWPLWANSITFLVAARSIAWAGTKLAAFGDRLADRTGLGEAIKDSLYHAEGVGVREAFLTSLAILLNITLLLGLLYRQRGGPANIGFESVLMLLLYIGGFLTLSLFM